MNTTGCFKRNGRRWYSTAVFVLGVLIIVVLIVGPASAAVWTDQADYQPGNVVTISGDNSDGAGTLPGETVIVNVAGPNGYAASCSAVADEAGAFSCPVTLWDNESAVGNYTYTATGQTSGVVQSGAFTDYPNYTRFVNLGPLDGTAGEMVNIHIQLQVRTCYSDTNCDPWHALTEQNITLTLGDNTVSTVTQPLNGEAVVPMEVPPASGWLTLNFAGSPFGWSPTSEQFWIEVHPNLATLTLTKHTYPPGGSGFPFTVIGLLDEWDGSESAAGIMKPGGITVDDTGNVYVVDYDRSRVLKLDPSGTQLLGEFPNWAPTDVAVDGEGNIFILDHLFIQKLDKDGNFLTKTDAWRWNGAVAVDQDGNVYLADTTNNRVRKFNNALELLIEWDGSSSGSGSFLSPGGVAVSQTGIVYVADTGNNRMMMFNTNGVFLGQWGSFADGFNQPISVDVDQSGNVYVVDRSNHRVQKFDSDGNFLTTWGSYEGVINFYLPQAVAVDSFGHIYISDPMHNLLKKFVDFADKLSDGDSPTLENLEPGSYFIREIPSLNWAVNEITCGDEEPVRGSNEINVDLNPGDNLSCTFTNTNTSQPLHTGTLNLEKQTIPSGVSTDFSFSIVGQLGQWNGEESGAGQFNFPVGVTTDNNGDVYVADYYRSRVLKFDPTGNHLLLNLSVANPYDIAVDDAGNIFVLEASWIMKFDRNGRFLTKVDAWRWNHGLAVDQEGNVYLADTALNLVRKFNNDLEFITEWDGSSSGSGPFLSPGGIAVSQTGIVYVADSGNNRVLIFDREGNYLGLLSSGSGDFKNPEGVDTDLFGNVYVVERNNHRVQKFDRDGNHLITWGNNTGFGQFWYPEGVAVDKLGHVYVADSLQYRIQKFTNYEATLNGGETTPFEVEPGSYYVKETLADPGRWSAAATCLAVYPASLTTAVTFSMAVDEQVTCIFTNTAINGMPIVSADNVSVTVNEGEQATNSGTYGDPDTDPVTLSASFGDLTLVGSSGWSWSFDSSDDVDDLTVILTARDNYGGVSDATFALVVNNVAPVFEAGLDETLEPLQEGAFNRPGINFSDPGTDVWSGTVDWGDGSSLQALGIDQTNKTFNLSHTYTAEGTFTVMVTVEDDDGGTHSDTLQVTVNLNNPPVADAGGPYTGDEEVAITLDGSGSSDPDGDALTFAWSVDSALCTFDDSSSSTPQLTCADDGTFNVTLVVDDGEETDSDTSAVSVSNLDPNLHLNLTEVTVGEGQQASNSGSYSDVAEDTVSLSADVGTLVDNHDGTWSWSFSSTDGPAESATVTLSAQDEDGGSATVTFELVVNNVAPTIESLSVPWEQPIDINNQGSFNVETTFSDPAGTADEPYTCAFDMNNDGQIDNTVSNVSGTTCSINLNYATPGVYLIKIMVSDKDGGVGEATAVNYVVIYNPDGGFVTGGGWIWSPLGACPRCPTSPIAKATFGFVSKYKKGAAIPDGNTEFQFKAGGLEFHSTSYEWLVIAGANAKYKGEGLVNGQGPYKFMLTATDGDLLGGGTPDEFRIRIWDDNGLYYDNMDGLPDEDYSGSKLGGGSIVVHKSK